MQAASEQWLYSIETRYDPVAGTEESQHAKYHCKGNNETNVSTL